ncbi:Spartin [Dactylella cylindrospora]|nr:Spartin [Dactylella cylindrospora]
MVQRTPPQVLYEVPYMNVYHLANGAETRLNDYPAPLTLLMVSTTTIDPFADTPVEEEDFYLHIQQLPNLDLPLPATTKIFRQYPRSYLIPRLDLDGGRGSCFTRVEFLDNRSQDDVDTFETILAQCTSFLENAKAPAISRSKSPVPGYSTQEYYGYGNEKSSQSQPQSRSYASGVTTRDMGGSSAGGYVPGSGVMAGEQYNYAGNTPAPSYDNHQQAGRLVLVDEQDGRIVGELSEGFNVVEGQGVEPGSKAPVEVTLPTQPGSHDLVIQPVSAINHADIFGAAEHPVYASSSIVSKAVWASKFIVTAATYAATAMENGATKFTQKTNPVDSPLTFTPTTHERVRKIHNFTSGASGISSKTIGKVQEVAQNIGAKMAGRVDRDGNEIRKTPSKPGILNKSMIAFSTLADGIDAASKHLLHSGSNAATTVVGHRYGDEAKQMAYGLTSSVKNVGLVYVDAAGVSRRAVVKSVAKGMVLGKVKGGGELVAASGDGSYGQVAYDGKNESQQTLWVPQNNMPGGSRPTTPQPPHLQHSMTAPPGYLPSQQQQPSGYEGGAWGGFGRTNSYQGQLQQPQPQKPGENWF